MATEWSVPRLWEGETAFILAGGPSLAGQGAHRLAGRRVIAVNSSYIAHPFADYLFSADRPWLYEHRAAIEGPWRGRVVTTTSAIDWDGLLHLRQVAPPFPGKAGGVAISSDPRALSVRRTSLHGAINMAVLLGATRLVLLGADGGRDAKGRTHHHAPHKQAPKPGCWDEQLVDLRTMVQPLKDLGVEVLNASPGSHWDLWPIVTLDDVLAAEPGPSLRASSAGGEQVSELRVFVCGLPKSGTSTLHRAFGRAGLVSSHGHFHVDGTPIALQLWRAFVEARDPLHYVPRGVEAICDAYITRSPKWERVSIWPTLAPGFLRSLREHHPETLILLNTRAPKDWLASIARWKDLRARIVKAELPFLPRGRGGEDAALIEWVADYHARVRAAFADDPRFLDVAIEDPETPARIAAALDLVLPWWGRANANRETETEGEIEAP
jgi:hypothetical protein